MSDRLDATNHAISVIALIWRCHVDCSGASDDKIAEGFGSPPSGPSTFGLTVLNEMTRGKCSELKDYCHVAS